MTLNKMHRNKYNKGISVIEIMIGLVVLGILFAVILPDLSKNRNDQSLKSGIQNILSALDKAKSQTLASLNSSEYGVHFQTDKVVIFKGQTFSSGTATNEDVEISPAEISTIFLTGGAADVYFTRLTGAPSATGTVTVTAGSTTKIITIYATGSFSSN
jgi:type II secretory pathway pseudopilin PulG